MFTESPDWTDSLSSNVAGNLFGLDLIDAPSTPQVLLVEVPDMNANQISEAENQLQAETRNSPGVGILLYGSGAPALRSRLGYYGYGQVTGFSFNFLGSEFWPTWEVVDGGLVLTMPTLTTLTPTLTTQTTQTPKGPARRRRMNGGRRRNYDWRKDPEWLHVYAEGDSCGEGCTRREAERSRKIREARAGGRRRTYAEDYNREAQAREHAHRRRRSR